MYADIVIDISHESLDRPFQYRIPESLVGQVQPGMWVLVPFGRRNTQKKGFVLKLGTKANIDPDRITIHQIRQELHLPFGCIGSMAEI